MIDPLTDRRTIRGSRPTVLSDNRMAPRRPCQATVTASIRSPDGVVLHPVWVRDVSTSGLGLVLPQCFAAGTILTVDLDQGARCLARSLLVRVIHADIELPHDAWLHGCAFLQPVAAALIEQATDPVNTEHFAPRQP